jgi:hypothetical protein
MSRHDPALRCHLGEPDYSRPLLEIDARSRKRILRELGILYGREQAEAVYPEIEREMRVYHAHRTPEMLEDDAVFAVLRTCLRSGQRLLALTNVTGASAGVRLSPAELGEPARRWRDALTGRWFAAETGELAVELQPYEVLWLRAEDEWFAEDSGRVVDGPTGRPR